MHSPDKNFIIVTIFIKFYKKNYLRNGSQKKKKNSQNVVAEVIASPRLQSMTKHNKHSAFRMV